MKVQADKSLEDIKRNFFVKSCSFAIFRLLKAYIHKLKEHWDVPEFWYRFSSTLNQNSFFSNSPRNLFIFWIKILFDFRLFGLKSFFNLFLFRKE
jgi:hypothetical protein